MHDILRIENLVLTILFWIGIWGIVDVIIMKFKLGTNQTLVLYLSLVLVSIFGIKYLNNNLNVLEYL